jgi:tripartite-type tricarboxylate transporter receptor subunit TctC
VANQTINITAAWTITMPPGTPQEVVDWYVTTFGAAVRTKEFQQWCRENVVYINEAELTPIGVLRDVKKMRETFLPILEKIDLSKD